MTITGVQVSEIAARAAGYLSDLAVVTPGALGAEFSAASSVAQGLAGNAAECAAIASTVNTLGEAVSMVWDYLKNKGHTNAAQALAATS